MKDRSRTDLELDPTATLDDVGPRTNLARLVQGMRPWVSVYSDEATSLAI
jgi:hypothetical protein